MAEPKDFFIECIDCGHQSSYKPLSPNCPKCSSPWRTVHYDIEYLKSTFLESLAQRPFDLWRYRELLPIQKPNPDLYLGEGGTPLVRAKNLGMMLGCSNLYIKDERQGPTSSFKDRQAAVTIAALKEAGLTEMVVASTGNVAISYSAYAARASIKLWAFLTSLVPSEKMREVALYGTQVVKVTGSYDQAKQVAAEFAHQRGIFLDQGARTVSSVEAMKTIAFEICEQLALQKSAKHAKKTPWVTPDWYIQSVSGGMGPLGVAKGFKELAELGLTPTTPRIGIIQAEGCAPMVHAWKQGLSQADPVHAPKTLIATLATGDPGRTYTLLNEIVHSSGGVFESVTDAEAFRAMHYLAKMEGLSVEPAAAVAFAGLVKLVRSGVVKASDVIVINCTGHTMSIENTILGEGWSRDIVFPSQEAMEAPQEGLLSALSHVAVDRFPRVAIVDDNPDVRRLVRRILQAQGDYKLFEASNGYEALQLSQAEHLDLIILDLMMPEMDGFSVLDRLKNNPQTSNIPVIVVTAKELTPDEKVRLQGQIKTLMQKGDFLSDDLLDEVRSLIR